MSEIDAVSGQIADDRLPTHNCGSPTISLPRHSRTGDRWLPYASISRRPLVAYWECLAIVTCIVCVVTQWSNLSTGLQWQASLNE
jgi:hypothetical protein